MWIYFMQDFFFFYVVNYESEKCFDDFFLFNFLDVEIKKIYNYIMLMIIVLKCF